MKRLLIKHKTLLLRASAFYLVLAIFFVGTPISFADTVTVDIKAEGSDGPVSVTNGNSFSYTWTSGGGATACEITTPSGVSGISLSGSDGPIAPAHPWYPSVGSSVTLTINCTDGTTSASDSVTINIVAPAVPVTVDIKAEGSDGPVTITNGNSFSYTWTSTGATACELTSPSGVSGISLSGSDGPIAPGHPWYPATSTPTTLTLNCTNGTTSVGDSVVINLTGATTGAVTADIKANGSDGPVTVTNGDSWSYSWTSGGATACELTSPSGVSGISLSGSDGPITPGHPWYPAVGGSTTLTLNCTNGTVSVPDSVVINVVATTTPPVTPPPGGGGGGGGGGVGGGGGGGHSGGSSRPPTPSGQVLGATTFIFCPYLSSYMRMGYNNDTLEVIKLQAFLKAFEHFDYVTVNGVFDQATFQAVSEFQLRYKDDVLAPWGISAPTGYAYIRTVGKINQILCGQLIPGVPYTAPHMVKAVKVVPLAPCACPVNKEMGGYKEGMATSTVAGGIPIVGQNIDKGHISDKGHPNNSKSLGAALLSLPTGAKDIAMSLYKLLLILVVLYILGAVLENVLYKDLPENTKKRFYSKWGGITVGVVLAFILAYFLNQYYLLLPLLVLVVAFIGWMLARVPNTPVVVVTTTPV